MRRINAIAVPLHELPAEWFLANDILEVSLNLRRHESHCGRRSEMGFPYAMGPRFGTIDILTQPPFAVFEPPSRRAHPAPRN
jgi:hypothetical protein